MIIQCEQCNTKFRLDDSKVTAKGVKVRCAKCKHVFSVSQEQPAKEETSDFGALLDQKTESAPEEQASALEQPNQSSISTPGDFEASPFSGNDFSEDTFGVAPEAARETDNVPPSGYSEFSFEDDGQAFSTAQNDSPAPAGDTDFSSFEFGDLQGTPEETPAEAPAWEGTGGTTAIPSVPESPGSAAEEEDSKFDFGNDNLFGDAVAPAHDEPGTPVNFDFRMDEFADSLGADDFSGEKDTAKEPRPEEPFSLGEIDFGDELTSVAVQQVNPEELKPGQDLLFAPLGTTPEKEAPKASQPEDAPQFQEEEELPPLSITSRRKQSSLLTALLGTLGVVAVAAAGYFGYSTLRGSQGGTAQEAGRITLRSVNAAYVKNSTAGDILVISGEAVNDFKKPRAALQVKGLVYGANGQVISSKVAYGGNPLTPEQLATMPMEKIEAAMANQFGDSLANLEVAPGKAIPFVVVIPGPPAGAKDYGVEAAGSTVASGKQ